MPWLLEGRHLQNLIALLPPTATTAFFNWQGLKESRLVYNEPGRPDDLEFLGGSLSDSGAQWAVALEEVSLFCSALDWQTGRLIELRGVLRQIGLENRLKETCHVLARRCWQEWLSTHNKSLRSAAYALAAETWLADEDVTDLIALLPQDFERFIKHGEALRVYRVARPAAAAGNETCTLDALLDGQISSQVDAPPAVAFPVLAPILKRFSAEPIIDLGPVLWKANQGVQLARSLWLLSRDLLEPRSLIWLQINAEPETITDLAKRAALIYSLSDPWQWPQGRYGTFLDDCYRHLDRCLQSQERLAGNSPWSAYYSALRHWYGCATAEDVESHLEHAVQAGKVFLESCQTASGPGSLIPEYEAITLGSLIS